jgi:hypothetical protein
MRNADSTNLVTLADIGGTFTNNTMVGGANNGLSLSENNSIGTMSGITIHSCAALGVTFGNGITAGTMSNFTIWRNASFGMQIAATLECVFSTITMFGNATNNISFPSAAPIGKITFISGTFNGDTTFSTTNGINFDSSNVSAGELIFTSCDFSTVSGIKTAHTNDFVINSAGSYNRIFLNNTKLGAPTEISGQTSMTPSSFISSQKNDQTKGLHKTWKKYGTITIDTVANMFRTASPSERLTPNNASGKLESGSKIIAVADGATLTPSVYVRESVEGDGTDYNGARIRLIVKRNDAIGITVDTVVATATVNSEGAFQQLTGVVGATGGGGVTDDGAMEFVVDCDGTTGWVNVDDWTVT